MVSLFYVVALAFLGCLQQACDGTSAGGEQENWSPHSPVTGLQLTYDDNGTVLFSTTFLPPDAGSLFSQASSSSIYRISGSADLTSGCLNRTVVSALALPPAEGGQAGSGEGSRREGSIQVVSCAHPPPNTSLGHCSWTRWLARAGESFSLPPLPHPWVLRSALSHRVKRTHRYKLEVCHLTGLPSSLPHTSCQLPHTPNGTIQQISHTYSITNSHTPFRIKMGLVCNEGHRLRKTYRTAECENGSWTQLPACLECNGAVCEGEAAAPVITTRQVTVGFVVGSNLTLDCEAKGHPKPSLSWHRVLLPSGDREPLLDHAHYHTHQNGSLTIFHLSHTDSGPYVCWVWNRIGSDVTYTHLFDIRNDRGRPPSIYHWSPLHVISPPRTLTPSHLHCHAHGYPPPIVTWSTLPLSPSLTPSPLPLPHSSQLWNGSLILNTLRTNDTRIYRCDATNLLGTVSMETILFVDATPAEGTPVIISANWSSNYTSSVGGCLQLYCPATSSAHNSPLNFIWMRKGGRVPMSGTRIRQNGNGTLLFDEVRPEDKGHYWCVVWNSGGVSMEMTSLIITNSSTEEPHPPTAVDSAPLHHHCLSLIATLSLVNTILS